MAEACILGPSVYWPWPASRPLQQTAACVLSCLACLLWRHCVVLWHCSSAMVWSCGCPAMLQDQSWSESGAVQPNAVAGDSLLTPLLTPLLSPLPYCRQVKDRMKKQKDAKTALKAKDIKASGPKAAKIAPRAGAKAGKR